MSEQIIVQNENEKENQSSDIENGSGVLEENVSVNDLPEILPEVLAEGGEEVLKPETNENVKEKEVLLKLGDIILISDPTNEILNDNIFLIEYIDPSKIKLINSETFEKIVLPIATDGLIGDGNIKAIKVISSNPENGFARQNELLPGTWVNIYFSGEIPTVITGEITNLEEDMIEIRTIDGDTLYINFNYQGIPEDIPIETFEIRPAIKSQIKEESAQELVDIGEEEELKEEFKQEVKQQIQKIFFDMNDLEFGDVVKVEEMINIDRDKYRYNIESQSSDLLEELISAIPSQKRTNSVLNNIHTMITRFLQLRQISSTFDSNKNITGIVKRSADDRPLAEYLADFRNSLYWIMLVAKNVKKTYDEVPVNTRYQDYEIINLDENLEAMRTLFQNYKNDKSVEGQNKYSNLYYSVDPYMTPFYSVNPDSANDVFSEPNGIIIEGNVESEINAIVDNLGDLYSTIVAKSEIKNRKFIIQRYNLGLDKLQASNLKGSKMIAHRVKLTQNDQISINSIITLPEPTVRFSQVNLPGSNLLVKANLNLHFLNYWQLLKQKTSINKIIIDGLDNELEYDDTNFVDNIKQYLLDLSEYEKPGELTNLDIYKIFLRTIIPKIRILFKLVKKYIKGRLSLIDVVNYLEPFMIYPIDLTYMQYKEINSFIYEKIKDYNILYKEYGMAFALLRYQKFQRDNKDKSVYIFSNPLFDLFGSAMENVELKTDVFTSYGFQESNKMKISGSEFLKDITLADFGNLFNTGVALTNVQLMFPSNLTEIFNADKNKMKEIIEKDKNNDKCSSFIISKKYYSNEALLADNEKPIYYDKEFDTTNYDIIEEKYKKERDSLSSEDFILYLTNQFKEKNKLDDESAESMALTLVNQAKRVREGDYAMLVKGDNLLGEESVNSIEYYKRNNDIWVLDNEVDPKTFIKEDDILCNIDYSCVYNPAEKKDEKCQSTELVKDTIVENTLKQIIDQFDKNYDISKTELNSKINNQLSYFIKIFDKLQSLKRKQFLQYNEKQYKLGLSVQDQIKDKQVSPYAKLRDLIMGQNDFIKKQNDIIKFVNIYCREGDPEIPNVNDGEMEDEWWMYCVKTNTKLLPKFHYILADTFVTNPAKYDDVLNELKRTIGKRSDEGDAWVDEHSGEVICLIDLDVSEGYRDGFVNKSRDILEKDAGEVMLEKQKEKREKRLSPEGEIISNIITVLSYNMGIDIESSRNFIIKAVTELMSDTKIIEKEPAYRKRVEESKVTLPSYGTLYSSTILYLTLGMYLIAIQTSIPSIKTRKTTPGCVRSFVGFPFEGEGDDSSLNYVACTALKSRDPYTIPWNVLPKNEEKIALTIKKFIIKYLLPLTEINERIKEKTEYLLSNPEQFIPDEYNINKWVNFLPPLKKFHIKNLQNISGGFTEELQNELFTGNYRQLEKLLVIESKIISFSLAIQECIQKLVEKKNLLLKSAGQTYMDNACCNEKDSINITSLQYFEKEDNSIEIYNNTVASLTSIMKDIRLLTDSAIMLSDVNTKRTFPAISTDFSEETIYYAFVTLCKFQSSIPLSEELATICIDKPDYIKKMDTIQEKMAKLKRDGRNYTKEQFLRLFQIVSRNNIIKMSMSLNNLSCVENLKRLLLYFDNENDDNVPKALTQKLEELTENYDVSLEEDTKTMRSMKDYLQNSIQNMRRELLEFLKLKGKLTNIELKNITKFINKIAEWRFDENPRNENIKISDDSLYNYVNFFKNFIELFVVVFPSMILNQRIQSIQPPKYWGLSQSHSKDVIEMVSNFYKPLEKFYGNSTIKNILNEIMSKCRGIYLLSQATPVLTKIKIGDKELYNVFDKRIITLLYEYYFLSVITDYIYLTKDPTMVTRMLVSPEKEETDIFSADFLIEQQLRFTESEQEFIQGDVMKLNNEVAKLIISYLTIMMNSKKTIDVSFDDIQDEVFKLKEGEKYTFTDKLKEMTDEARAVDTILKHNKLGPLYSIGLSKGIKEYDPDNFDHDKKVAEAIAEIQNKLRRNRTVEQDVDLEIDDAINEMQVEREIDLDNALNSNMSDDYNDGDPWGDEQEDYDDYN